MRIYLSTVLNSNLRIDEENFLKLLKENYILHSFAFDYAGVEKYYSVCKDLMLDSGAFTVMNSKRSRNNFDPMQYCKKYATHVKKNDIKFFLELDIESVYGFEVYRDCLHCLQDITGRDPIYVFHKWRGINYYKELVKKHKYVALGDVNLNGGSRKSHKYFPWFIEEAHKNGCRIHGLAFTSFKELRFTEFDSVDSSTWTMGGRYARPVRFDGHLLNTYICKRNEKMQLDHNYVVKLHDFGEWQKAAQYFDSEYEPIW